jgi:hypothetical protein
MEALAPIDAFKLIVENADAIEKFPEHRFTTSDRRTFGIFFDGERILALLELDGVGINHNDKAGLERIKKVAGFIVELGGDDPPLIFGTGIQLATAWEQLHAFYGVPISKEEDGQYLDIILDGFPRFEIDTSEDNEDQDNQDSDQ